MTCRSCRAPDLFSVIDLGSQRLADFRDDPAPTDAYPLELVFCPACSLAQLRDSVPAGLMYHERYGFKSGVNDTIRADLASVVKEALTWVPEPESWLDIASNDGTLLSNVSADVYRVGIDPVGKLCAEAERHATLIVNDYFDRRYFPGKFDVVTSISMFYDLDDPNRFVADVKGVMADNAVWVVQQNYTGTMLDWNAVDNICHEHRTYFSLHALEHLLHRHGLEIVDVSLSPVNGGSFRTIITRTGERPVQPSVARLRRQERLTGLDTITPYLRFAQTATEALSGLHDLVVSLNTQGDRVWIYGASTRGGTLWQSALLTSLHLPFAVDRNPAKVGRFMSSIGSRIVSEQHARDERPEYMVVSPWFFRDEFIKREANYLAAGGRFIFPLPKLEVVAGTELVAA